MAKYEPRDIESKWQKKWLEERIYEPDLDKAKRPFYNLMMFPYPSAEGLHVGNMYAFTGSDIYGRKKRMEGYDVFEPIGLDGFGIHSENYAMKVGTHPLDQSKKSEIHFYDQLQKIGNGFAWDERAETYKPEYYHWTQWLFAQMWKHDLAYRKKQSVNWCPKDQTVLSDEQVEDGKCERCGTVVIKKELEQWSFRITKYADRLLDNLEKLDWSEKVKIAQKNWIGRSEGAMIKFQIADPRADVEVFTTRPDTLFGATYLVLAPEHPLIEELKAKIENWNAVSKYVIEAKSKNNEERSAEGREKTGVLLEGVKAVNPANKEEISVWVADYVLGSYGTGAIMAVPAHDERDFEFAKKFKLPVKQVIRRTDVQIRSYVMGTKNIKQDDFEALGISINCVTEDGNYEIEIPKESITAFEKLIAEKMEPGFWNEYIADEIVFIFKHKNGQIERLIFNDENSARIDKLACEFNDIKYDPDDPENYINGALANNEWYRPLIIHSEKGILISSGKFSGMDSEAAKWEITKFVHGERKMQFRLRDWLISRQRYWGPPIPMIFCESCAKAEKGEHKDMPGWYAVLEKDLPIELPYVKDFRPTGSGVSPLAADKEFSEVKCPVCEGMARRETDVSDTFLDSAWYYLRYLDPKNEKSALNDARIKRWLPAALYTGGAEHSVLHLLYVRFVAMALHDWGLVDFEEPFKKFRAHGLIIKDGAKMSKSKGNVVNPDEYIANFGADTLRMYLIFLAPFEQGGDFRDSGVLGIERFLKRAWQYAEKASYIPNKETHSLLHKTIKKVSEDIEDLHYNTAISALMILLNGFEERGTAQDDFEIFLKLLAPFAPHITEEIWREQFGHKTSIHRERWPEYDPKLLIEDTVTIVLQVNGKVRDTIKMPAAVTEEEAKAAALTNENVKRTMGNVPQKKIIYVDKKLVNIVV
ncbi:MAG: class I tRNA ligase family protein [Minisyncoccia bacterium]